MVIQHNLSAINSHKQLNVNNKATSKNLEKLSSGFQINRADDDAADLAISEKMRGQIRGLSMATQNAQNGVALIQTAEGGLNETHSILQRMRELAVQSSNGTYADEVDRDNINKESQALKEEINRIANSTHYNGIKVLNGLREIEEMPEPPLNATRITDGTVISGTIDKDIVIESGTTVTISGDTSIDPGVKVYVMENATLITPYNDIAYLSSLHNTGTIYNNGNINIGSVLNKIDAGTGDFGTVINYSKGVMNTGIYTSGQLPTSVNTVINYGTMRHFANTGNSTLLNYGQIKNVYNRDGGTIYNHGTISWLWANENSNGVLSTIENFGTIVEIYDEGETNDPINQRTPSITLQVGANGTADQRITVPLRNMDAHNIGIKKPNDNSRWLDPDLGEHFRHGYNIMEYTVWDISLDTRENANDAIMVIDAAINQVSSTRADLGALQNRLEHSINNLGTTRENLQAAESTIRDVDMAKELMGFTKNNILIQTAQSMLAQSNQLPQGVLQLLR